MPDNLYMPYDLWHVSDYNWMWLKLSQLFLPYEIILIWNNKQSIHLIGKIQSIPMDLKSIE